MIKRALCVIMCCVIAAALSLSVFASPLNIYNSSYVIDEISFLRSGGTTRCSFTPFSLDFGTNYIFNVDFVNIYSDYVNPFLTGEFTITLDFPSTVFIACSSSYSLIEPVNWDRYRDTTRDFSVQYTNENIISHYIEFDFDEFLDEGDGITDLYSGTSSFNGTVYYTCFDEVPAGTYTLTYGFTTPVSPVSDMRNIICGLYITGFSINDPVGSFNDGSIDFSAAINAINSNLNDILDSPNSTNDEKILAVNLADYDLNRIKQSSDVKFNGAVNEFSVSSETIIDNFVNGNATVNDSISNLQLEYFDALSQAVTPEQGSFLNTSFQVQLDKLHLLWQVDFKQELDDVVSDDKLDANSEKLSAIDQLYSEEKEVLNHFELAEFESKLEFSLWTDTLPSDYANYKAIFEYFLEDNKAYQISQFLIVPFSLVLVSVLLATTTVILRRSRNG